MQKYILYTRKDAIKRDEGRSVDWGKLSQQYGVRILYTGNSLATVLADEKKLRIILSDHPELNVEKISKKTN